LYFVADGTGHHIFTRTLKEHNRAKRQVKQTKKDLAP
jgi:cell division protein YceG involved in septum cleavage